jgi:hypothetical protein
VIDWLPDARVVVKLAPKPLKAALPRVTPLSRKVTVPNGVPVPGAAARTVAVKVTGWPATDAFTEDVTVVRLPLGLTV